VAFYALKIYDTERRAVSLRQLSYLQAYYTVLQPWPSRGRVTPLMSESDNDKGLEVQSVASAADHRKCVMSSERKGQTWYTDGA